MSAKKGEKKPVEARKWCASWLFKEKAAKHQRLPRGVKPEHVVREDEPTKVDLQGRLVGPKGGGSWVFAVPPAWVK